MKEYQPPFTYAEMNNVNGHGMNAFLHISQSGIAEFFKRYLFQEAMSVFDFTLPEHWDVDYFRRVLLGWGYIAIIKTDKFGVIPQQCQLAGYNVFYRPVNCLIANPLLKSRTLEINKDCALIKIAPDYYGIGDIVDNYGNMLALMYQTTSINTINSRLSYVFSVEDNAAAQTAKSLIDNIMKGELATVTRKKSKALPDDKDHELFQQNVGQNFIVPELLDSMEKVRDMFLSEIGIPNLSTRKKERVNIEETEKNSVETMCKAELWLEEMREGIEKARYLFPEIAENFSVKLRFPDKGVNANVRETVNNGVVLRR